MPQQSRGGANCRVGGKKEVAALLEKCFINHSYCQTIVRSKSVNCFGLVMASDNIWADVKLAIILSGNSQCVQTQ